MFLVYFSRILFYKYKLIFLILLGLLPALQYNVGTDYLSYVNIINSVDSIDQFLIKGEYFSYIIIFLINNFELHSQFFFIITSFLSAFTLIKVLEIIETHNLNITIILFILIFATGIYHNQFNLIRNYLAIIIFIYALYIKYCNNNIYSLALVIIASFFHASIIYLLILFLVPNNNLIIASNFILKGLLFQVGIILFVFFYKYQSLDTIFFYYLKHNFIYFHYLNNYTELNIKYLFLKLIYVPLFFLFYINFKKIPINNNFIKYNIGIWSYSWLLPVIGSFNEFGLRISSYTNFFYIFPIYFLLKYCSLIVRFFTFVYIIIFYLIKIILISKLEYRYESILFI